jgi:hypothetical protein
MADRFYGKFRGVVRNDRDPQGLGRLQVYVPDVLGAQGAWAMPCLPCTPPDGPAIFVLPAVGANVWVEFEAGDPDYPIWAGCYWTTAADMPPLLGPTEVPPP